MRATSFVMAMAVVAMLATTVFTCAPNTAKTYAARVKNVAVVDTRLDIESGASAVMNADEVREITDELRREAIKNLPRNKYNIMTTETVYAQGGAVVEECSDENCAVILGNKIGADYVVRGTIRKFQTMLTLSVEMYETENGNLVAISDPIRSERPIELLGMVAGACGEMYRKFVNPRNYAPKPKPTPTPEPVAQQTGYQTLAQSAPTPTYQTPTSTSSHQQSGGGGFGTFTDSRDGRKYKTVVIGGKKWMAENLNYWPRSGASWCYKNNISYCNKYGQLYDWNTANTICPSGWHLPSSQEWDDLLTVAGSSSVAGKKLKAKIGWNNRGNGTDDFGFSALPGGYRDNYDGGFDNAGSYGYWWTAKEAEWITATPIDEIVFSNHGGSAYRAYKAKSNGNSVRCIGD